MTNETETDSEGTVIASQDEPRKYAGKFETIEQLEEGYKNSAKVYQENEALRKQLETPSMYQKPAGLELPEAELAEIQQLAKNAGLNQAHFDKLATGWQQRGNTKRSEYEQQVKDLGEQNINTLKDYVGKLYPEALADTVLHKLIVDKSARDSALKHREQLLNSSVPGLGKVNIAPQYTVTHDDVVKSREKAIKNPADMRARENYIKMTGEFARQNEALKAQKG